jgi:hypothetical protein
MTELRCENEALRDETETTSLAFETLSASYLEGTYLPQRCLSPQLCVPSQEDGAAACSTLCETMTIAQLCLNHCPCQGPRE